MALIPGTRLGPYEIQSAIGAGGMGEVYRARDTKLNRDVAIKVLPESVANDPERLARFSREAQVLAALNHPNIAHIHGFEDSTGVPALVMELVEGPTLADRIAKGPIPLGEALPIAKQIADALEAAHEQGIIHRDLKPANIKVRDDGTVKVLDYGLAKALDTTTAPNPNVTHSPTIITPAMMTGVGKILGTAAYMSPEQARGKVVDKRADIWAFGAVLYEMVCGKRAFEGDTLTDVIAAVVTREPDWLALPASTPSSLKHLLSRCFTKDPKGRLRDIGEARVAIEGLEVGTHGENVLDQPPDTHRKRATEWMRWAIGFSIAAIGVSVGWLLRAAPPARPETVTRFAFTPPTDQQLPVPRGHILALSPDGTRLIYAANRQIYSRTLDQLEAGPIRGTNDNPRELFFSPDGQWIGYFAGADNTSSAIGQLKKIPASGGAPVTLASVTMPSGAAWIGNRIIFGQTNSGIFEIPAAGGALKPLVAANKQAGEWLHGAQLLPDGSSLLFTVGKGRDRWDEADIVVQSLKTGMRKTLIHGGTDAHYLPTGHIVYAREGVLIAVAFDVGRLEVNGGGTAMAEGVTQEANSPSGAAQFSTSNAGSLAYLPGYSGASRRLVWVDRHGIATPIAAPPKAYITPRVSPDGSRIAVDIRDHGVDNLWTWDAARETLTRLTSKKPAALPVWTPDGQRVVFSENFNGIGGDGMFSTAADGSGVTERLTTSTQSQNPQSVTSDGKFLVFSVSDNPSATANEVMALSLDSRHQIRSIVRSAEFSYSRPEVSPDGRWVAYMSNESGDNQVYVRPFGPEDHGRWQVSSDAAVMPAWSPDARELFFADRSRGLMAVKILPGPQFRMDKPQLLFPTVNLYDMTGPGRAYDISPDGKRFLMLEMSATPPAQKSFTVVQQWFEELKARVPTK